MKALKILFFILAFFAVVFTVMANMGGSNDTLKGAIEQFLTESTGYKAEISTLNNMSFFPAISVDMEGVRFLSADRETVATVAHAEIAMGFWDVMFKNQKIRQFALLDIHVKPGVITPKAIALNQLGIFEATNQQAVYFLVQGKWGERKVSLISEMNKINDFGTPKYIFDPKKFVTVSLGDMSVDAALSYEGNHMHLSDITLQNERDVVTGALEFIYEGTGRIGLGGELFFDETSVKPALNFVRASNRLSGEVVVRQLDLGDVVNENGFPFALSRIWYDALGGEPMAYNAEHYKGRDIDVTLKLEDLTEGGQHAGHASLPLSIKDGHLEVGPITGELVGKTLSGTGCVEARLFGLENIMYALPETTGDFSQIYPCAQFYEPIAKFPSEVGQ